MCGCYVSLGLARLSGVWLVYDKVAGLVRLFGLWPNLLKSGRAVTFIAGGGWWYIPLAVYKWLGWCGAGTFIPLYAQKSVRCRNGKVYGCVCKVMLW